MTLNTPFLPRGGGRSSDPSEPTQVTRGPTSPGKGNARNREVVSAVAMRAGEATDKKHGLSRQTAALENLPVGGNWIGNIQKPRNDGGVGGLICTAGTIKEKHKLEPGPGAAPPVTRSSNTTNTTSTAQPGVKVKKAEVKQEEIKRPRPAPPPPMLNVAQNYPATQLSPVGSSPLPFSVAPLQKTARQRERPLPPSHTPGSLNVSPSPTLTSSPSVPKAIGKAPSFALNNSRSPESLTHETSSKSRETPRAAANNLKIRKAQNPNNSREV
jgi:hypothetical protein